MKHLKQFAELSLVLAALFTTAPALAAVRLITKDNVTAIFGEFHSSIALAEIEEAHKYGVPWIGTDVWSDALTAKQYPEVFRLSPANSLVYVKAADWSATGRLSTSRTSPSSPKIPTSARTAPKSSRRR